MARNEQGMVLIIVLWILTILSVMAVGLAHTSRLEMKIAGFNLDQTRALALASSGIEAAIAGLRNKDEALTEEVTLEDGRISFRISDEESKLNLNFADERMLETLPGIDDKVSDAILDWVDEDDLHRLNGAEDSYYQGLDPAYHCKNGPFDTIEESLLVKDVTLELMYGEDANQNGILDPGEDENQDGKLNRGLIELITVWTSGKVNINTASKQVLQAFFGKSEIVDQIIAHRENIGPFKSKEEAAEKIPQVRGLMDNLAVKSSNFRIKSTGISNRAVKRVTAIVNRDSLPIRINYWRED